MSFDTGGSYTESGTAVVRGLRRKSRRPRQPREPRADIAARYEVLLREGNHRIKNSLQIVSSLINLQAGREDDPHVREALNSAAMRVQSVARMHDALQASEGEDSVDLGAVLETMCGSLQAMGGDVLGAAVRVEARSFHVPVAFARSVGLAVNELVVNALRHAFSDGRTGSILVRLVCAGGQLRLLVADDGVGLPVGYSESRGYGMKLVRMMVSQINGVLYVDSGAGTRITMVMPEPRPVAAAHDQPAQAMFGCLDDRVRMGPLPSRLGSATPKSNDGNRPSS